MGTQAAALAVDDSRMQPVDWGSTDAARRSAQASEASKRGISIVRADAASKDVRVDDTQGEPGSAARAVGLIQFISFSIDNDQYGVDIMSVREIKGWSDITHIPKQPEHVR